MLIPIRILRIIILSITFITKKKIVTFIIHEYISKSYMSFDILLFLTWTLGWGMSIDDTVK